LASKIGNITYVTSVSLTILLTYQ